MSKHFYFRALYFSFFGLLLIFILLTVDALVIFANFIGCEPYADGQIKTVDQVAKDDFPNIAFCFDVLD